MKGTTQLPGAKNPVRLIHSQQTCPFFFCGSVSGSVAPKFVVVYREKTTHHFKVGVFEVLWLKLATQVHIMSPIFFKR